MKDLLDKLSSYNIFNYLLPGVLFAVILSKITNYNLIQEDIIIGAFLYYFIGLIISRIGSIVIEPFLKFIRLVKFAEYKKFVAASKNDAKIELYSEINNMYRTIVSLILMLILIKLFEYVSQYWLLLQKYGNVILIIFLLILFVLSYRKQTKFIVNRIEAHQTKKEN
jgi:hypothetical protein